MQAQGVIRAADEERRQRLEAQEQEVRRPPSPPLLLPIPLTASRASPPLPPGRQLGPPKPFTPCSCAGVNCCRCQGDKRAIGLRSSTNSPQYAAAVQTFAFSPLGPTLSGRAQLWLP